jgi:hypothetical protein
MGAILPEAACEWLSSHANDSSDDIEQIGPYAAAEPFLGALSGSGPSRAENASAIVKKTLLRNYVR